MSKSLKIAMSVILLVAGLVSFSLYKIHETIKGEPVEIHYSSIPPRVASPYPDEEKPVVLSTQVVDVDKAGIMNWLDKFSIYRPISLNRITQCSGYGCMMQKRFQFSPDDMEQVKRLFVFDKDGEAERLAISEALDVMKKIVGESTCTIQDRPGEPFLGNGDPCQMSTLDETTNTAQYLYLLASHNLIHFHNIKAPGTAKWYMGSQNNIQEIASGKFYAVTYDDQGHSAIVLNPD